MTTRQTPTRVLGEGPGSTDAESDPPDEQMHPTTASEPAASGNEISATHPCVLVPYDGSTQADRALEQALIQFAAEEIIVFYVLDVSGEHELFEGIYSERITGDDSRESLNVDTEPPPLWEVI